MSNGTTWTSATAATNWAAPGAIGATTPSSATFTSLTASGNIGIGTISPNGNLESKTSATNNSVPDAILANSSMTVNGSGTYWGTGIESIVTPLISSGVTNQGDMYALVARGYRASSSDSGTLGGIYGSWVGYGHSEATARVTGRAVGVFVAPQHAGGTISDDYGILIGNANGTVMPANYYGLYQQDATAKNYFAGNVGIGSNAPTAMLDVAGDLKVSGKYFGSKSGVGYVQPANWSYSFGGSTTTAATLWSGNITVPQDSIIQVTLGGHWQVTASACYISIGIDDVSVANPCSAANTYCYGWAHTYSTVWENMAHSGYAKISAGTHKLSVMGLTFSNTCSLNGARISYMYFPQ
jgi:hypothetical protein